MEDLIIRHARKAGCFKKWKEDAKYPNLKIDLKDTGLDHEFAAALIKVFFGQLKKNKEKNMNLRE